MTRIILTLAIAILLGVGAAAASTDDVNGDGFVTILVPIAMGPGSTIHGAHGSIWAEETWVYNASDKPLFLQPPHICFPLCVALEARALVRNWGFESNRGYGALLNIPAAAAPTFHMSARLLELSRRAQPTGAAIPVVPESQFLVGESWLLGVPAGSAIRAALRVFAPRAGQGELVLAEFYGPDGGIIGSATLRPGLDPSVPQPSAQPNFYAGLDAILDLTGSIDGLFAAEFFHIRLRPLTEGAEYWAFVSVTDNETQHVLFITPEP